MRTILLAVITSLSLSCAMTLSPLPGMEVGVNSQGEGLKMHAKVDTVVTGCQLARKAGWEYMIRIACQAEMLAAAEARAEAAEAANTDVTE